MCVERARWPEGIKGNKRRDEMGIPSRVTEIVSKEDVESADAQYRSDKEHFDKGEVTEEMKKRGWG